MKLLVVDDEIIQLQSLKRGIRSRGYQVSEALNAEEALEQLERNGDDIDIVLTDYFMPGMNGIELLKKIRENHNSLPVMIMTAYGEKDMVIEALRNRCDSFIEKPFTLDQLMVEIERAKMNIIQNTKSDQLYKVVPMLVHQINNPLTAILGNAELAMLGLDDEEDIKKYIKKIIECSKMISFINQKILQLGQGEDIKIEELNLKTLLDNCLYMFTEILELKGVSVEKDLDDLDVHVLGNQFNLEQVFKNLILNAIDSMDGSHQKLLKISAKVDLKESSVSIQIKDTGCGIPEASIDKIFAQYFTTKKSGTGLGLCVVKNIVEKLKGTISVESEVGKGTTFTVTLPVINN